MEIREEIKYFKKFDEPESRKYASNGKNKTKNPPCVSEQNTFCLGYSVEAQLNLIKEMCKGICGESFGD